MDTKLSTVYCKSENVVARELEDELIIIPMISGIGDMDSDIYALNETGQEIWKRIDGNKKLSEIIDDLKAVYDSPADTIREDVLGLINEIAKRKFITALDD